MRTSQQQIKSILEGLEIPNREIKCYGSQITVECSSEQACLQYANVIKRFATIRKIIKSLVEKKHSIQNAVNVVDKSYIEVYRLYAVIK